LSKIEINYIIKPKNILNQIKVNKTEKLTPKSWGHNGGTPNHAHRSRIMLEPGDTIVDPHTNQEPTL
jgi:hypothetical protein